MEYLPFAYNTVKHIQATAWQAALSRVWDHFPAPEPREPSTELQLVKATRRASAFKASRPSSLPTHCSCRLTINSAGCCVKQQTPTAMVAASRREINNTIGRAARIVFYRTRYTRYHQTQDQGLMVPGVCKQTPASEG